VVAQFLPERTENAVGRTKLGDVALADLVRPTMRLRPDRISGGSVDKLKAPINCVALTQLAQFGGSFHDFAPSGVNRIKGLGGVWS
jgi:hypothetical protein